MIRAHIHVHHQPGKRLSIGIFPVEHDANAEELAMWGHLQAALEVVKDIIREQAQEGGLPVTELSDTSSTKSTVRQALLQRGIKL